mmetsp:Transcript_4760/g.13749  ORF Transcript_4760/g.13749 Transcript_4760/m.13749 type:complete len:427 (-) Transcript_4760:822-2102(-)
MRTTVMTRIHTVARTQAAGPKAVTRNTNSNEKYGLIFLVTIGSQISTLGESRPQRVLPSTTIVDRRNTIYRIHRNLQIRSFGSLQRCVLGVVTLVFLFLLSRLFFHGFFSQLRHFPFPIRDGAELDVGGPRNGWNLIGSVDRENSVHIRIDGPCHLANVQGTGHTNVVQVVRAQKIRSPGSRRPDSGRSGNLVALLRRIVSLGRRNVLVHSFVPNRVHGNVRIVQKDVVLPELGQRFRKIVHQHGREKGFVRHEFFGPNQPVAKSARQTVRPGELLHQKLANVWPQRHPLAPEKDLDARIAVHDPVVVRVFQVLGGLVGVVFPLVPLLGKLANGGGHQSRLAGDRGDEIDAPQRAAKQPGNPVHRIHRECVPAEVAKDVPFSRVFRDGLGHAPKGRQIHRPGSPLAVVDRRDFHGGTAGAGLDLLL